jgi:radical SAM protein with 4Fe4S-binding SPASM domain
MSPDEFSLVIKKIKPFTEYIYLHVLGEPLLHPQLDKLLEIAAENNINVNITSNGSLIGRKKDILLQHPVRQINISLHDAEENISDANFDSYISSILNFAIEAAPKTYINLRLWNSGVESSEEFQHKCMKIIADRFGKSTDDITNKNNQSGIKLQNHIFLQQAPRFEWPDGKKDRTKDFKSCYALKDHIAILCDGTIVPCCLDAGGNINLGNIFTDELKEVLQSERSTHIKKGFEQNVMVESFCKSCGFFIREN